MFTGAHCARDSLNERAKSLGWKGIGILVAAQKYGRDYALSFSEGDKKYWRERILWSKQADAALAWQKIAPPFAGGKV